jgi:succinyl-CoA synthetase beta subunit
VLIAQDVYYPGASEPKEFYVSILLDRATNCNVVMASTEGGMDIEEVAANTPEKIIKEWIDPGSGIKAISGTKNSIQAWSSRQCSQGNVKFIHALYQAYFDSDASLI